VTHKKEPPEPVHQEGRESRVLPPSSVKASQHRPTVGAIATDKFPVANDIVAGAKTWHPLEQRVEKWTASRAAVPSWDKFSRKPRSCCRIRDGLVLTEDALFHATPVLAPTPNRLKEKGTPPLLNHSIEHRRNEHLIARVTTEFGVAFNIRVWKTWRKSGSFDTSAKGSQNGTASVTYRVVPLQRAFFAEPLLLSVRLRFDPVPQPRLHQLQVAQPRG
jgi:hypothetical protein